MMNFQKFADLHLPFKSFVFSKYLCIRQIAIFVRIDSFEIHLLSIDVNLSMAFLFLTRLSFFDCSVHSCSFASPDSEECKLCLHYLLRKLHSCLLQKQIFSLVFSVVPYFKISSEQVVALKVILPEFSSSKSYFKTFAPKLEKYIVLRH